MHAMLKSSQILLTTLLIISIICEIECFVNFLDFFKNFEEDLNQDQLVTDRCSTIKEEKLKCYWKILENELIHLFRAAKSDNQGIFGFNNNTKALIFLRRLIDLTRNNSISRKNQVFVSHQNYPYLNSSIIESYDIKWYNNYDFDDIDKRVEQLSKIELGNHLFANSGNKTSKNENNSRNLTIKLAILSILYKQYLMDKFIYRKLIKDKDSLSNYIQNLLKIFNTEMVLLNQDIQDLIKDLEISSGKIETRRNIFKSKFIFVMKNLLSELLIFIHKASNSFDNIRKKLYSRVLEYYLWIIIIAKLFFICTRKLISMILLIDHILIYILDHLEDYTFMLISLQFTIEMVFTLIQEIIPLLIISSA